MKVEIDALIQRMTNKEKYTNSQDSVSWNAHREAEKLNDYKIFETIKDRLEKKIDKDTKAAIYFIIGKIGKNLQSKEIGNYLLLRLKMETDKYIISNVLDLIQNIPKDESNDLSIIYAYLSEERWLIRHSAISSLRNTKDKITEDILLNHIEEAKDKIDIAICNGVLNTIGTQKSIPKLMELSKSKTRDIKISAKFALEEIEKRHPTTAST